MRVLVLNHAVVHATLPPDECRDAMAKVLAANARGEAFMPLRTVMMPPSAAGLMGLMPAWRGGTRPVFSLKAVCVMPGNPARGLDTHQGTVTLFDGETGQPTALLNASAITEIRTAAVSAVATEVLARDESRELGILGAGVQAAAHVQALLLVLPFTKVRIYSPTVEHARKLVSLGAPEGSHAELSVASSAEEAVRGADVVVTATNSREPVLRREWIAPGTHINAVGASIRTARELDVETVASSALFVDSRESWRNEAGEFQKAVEDGAIKDEDHVRAELGEVVAGRGEGRRDDDEVTLFRSLGLAIEDLAAAELAVAQARALGLGTEVDL